MPPFAPIKHFEDILALALLSMMVFLKHQGT